MPCLPRLPFRELRNQLGRVAAGNYTLNGIVGFELSHKTYGVVGTGNIGIEVRSSWAARGRHAGGPKSALPLGLCCCRPPPVRTPPRAGTRLPAPQYLTLIQSALLPTPACPCLPACLPLPAPACLPLPAPACLPQMIKLLRCLDGRILAYDPYPSEEAKKLGGCMSKHPCQQEGADGEAGSLPAGY